MNLPNLILPKHPPSDPIVGFKGLKGACLISGSSLVGDYAIIPAKSFAELFPGVVCYTPEEIQHLLSLGEKDAATLHLFKRKIGGFIVSVTQGTPKEKKECSAISEGSSSSQGSSLDLSLLD